MHFQEGSRKKLILSSRGKGLHNGACVKPTKPQTKKIRCGGELPENVEDTSTHYEDVECMYNSTTKKYDCPEVKWKYKFSIWERSSEREILLEDCGCGYSSDNNDV